VTADRQTKAAGPVVTNMRSRLNRHFCDGLKYRKSGGAWSFLVGIRRPSALSI
jgi:hypothetical protein